MKIYMLTGSIALLFGVVEVHAQPAGDISGRYLVPKGPSIVEIVHEGRGYQVMQISAPVAKDQENNGKVRALIPEAEAIPLAGTVNDFD